MVASETFASGEEQDAFTSAETQNEQKYLRTFFNAGVTREELCSYGVMIRSSGPAWLLLGRQPF